MITIAEGSLTRTQLAEIPIISREGTGKYWKGIPHIELADQVIETINEFELNVLKETWGTTQKGAVLLGCVDIAPDSMDSSLDIGTPAAFSLAVRHSNNQRFPLTFGIGIRVFICSNGMMTAEHIIKRRHTHNLNVRDMVEEGVHNYIKGCQSIQREIEKLGNTDVDDVKAHDIMVRAAMNGTMPFQAIQHVAEQWHNPIHDIFNDRNAWSLHNAFTEVAKKFSAENQFRLLRGIYPLIKESVILN